MSHHRARSWRTGATMAVSLAVMDAHAALAQDQPVQTADASGGEIVVTASKRGAKLQDLPISVTALAADTLLKSNITSLAGVQRIVPNLRFTTVTGTPEVFIRGVGGGGRNIGFDPRVGVYVDGVFIGDTAQLDAVLVGVESVEVLRGPQGFLFGASTDAGAINVVTKAPTSQPSADGSIAYGKYHDVQLMAHANIPLGDKIFADISGVRRTRDGYIDNIYDGSKPNDVRDYGVRGRIRFVPTEDLTFDLAADYTQKRTHLVVGEPLTGPFGTGPSGLMPYQVNQNHPEVDARQAGGVSATMNYRGTEVRVTSITAYRVSERHWNTDTDHTPFNYLTVDYHDKYRTFSQEITLATTDSARRFRYLVGTYFSDASNSSDRKAPFGSDSPQIGLSPDDEIIALPRLDTRIFSIYGSIDYDVLPKLTLDVGARVSLEHRVFDSSQQGVPALGFASFANFRDSINETNTMPTASVTYKFAKDVTIYGRYARGVKSGGLNADFVNTSDPGGLPYRYKPETVDSYELGVKSSLLDHKLTANTALFLNNFRDYQVFQYRQVNGITNLSLTNAGRVKTYGIELELTAQPIDGLTVSANGSRLIAKYASFPNGGGIGVNYDGNRLEYAPRWNMSGRIDYTHAVALVTSGYVSLGADYYHRGNSFADPSNASSYLMASSDLLSARLGVGQREPGRVNWLLSLSAENLLKSRSFNNISVDALGVLVGFREDPRRYLAKLEVHY